MASKYQLDTFRYGFHSWNGSEWDIHVGEQTFDELQERIVSNAKSRNNREFFITIQSNVQNGLHIPMLDFDIPKNNTMPISVIKSKMYLSIYAFLKKYNIKEGAFIFSTKNGYHVILNKIVTWDEYKILMTECCQGFAKAATGVGFAKLRIGCKPLHSDDIKFAGFVSPVINVNSYDIFPAIADFMIVHQHLTEVMHKVYIYDDKGNAIYPKFVKDNPSKGFYRVNNVIQAREVDPNEMRSN